MVECGPCPVFASFTLAFALKLRKKHRKIPIRVRKTSVRLRKTSVTVQCTVYILPKTPTHYKALTNTHIAKPTHSHTHTHTRTRTHTHTYTLQNNIKSPQYKLKQNAIGKSTQ